MPAPSYIVGSAYAFTPIDTPGAWRGRLLGLLAAQSVRGTVILAPEGFNASLWGTRAQVHQVFDWLRRHCELPGLKVHESPCAEPPFHYSRVKVRDQLVNPGLKPYTAAGGGHLVGAQDWHALLDDPETLVLDLRNTYEIGIGQFPEAVNPGFDSFREFADYARDLQETTGKRRLAMYCTGGIRCEKAAALLADLGMDEVHQLKGGILRYLSDTPPAERRWQGDCFVFDERIGLTGDLRPGDYTQCPACRRPLDAAARGHPDYRVGERCGGCAAGMVNCETAAVPPEW